MLSAGTMLQLFVLTSSVVASAAQIADDVTFIQSGAMKVVPASISDIEVDKFRNDGSLLVSWGSALINTDGLRNEIIAGAPLTPGANKDAKGLDARFDKITAFAQVDNTTVIIADSGNCCLKKLDRVTGIVSDFSGDCMALYRKQECRLADGAPDDARFAWPSDVLINERDPSKLLVLGDGSHAIREVDIATGVVSTIYESVQNLERPRAAIFDKNNKDILYIAHRRKFSTYNFATKEVKLITGDTKPVNKKQWKLFDGDLDNATYSNYIADVVQLSNDLLAISDHWVHKVRIIDMKNKNVWSLCSDELIKDFKEAPRAKDKDRECDILNPVALMFNEKEGKLYIGENGRITVKQVLFGDTFPADVLG